MQQVNLPYIMPCKQENYVRLIMSILTFLVHVNGVDIGLPHKKVHKVPLVSLCDTLQMVHQLLC